MDVGEVQVTNYGKPGSLSTVAARALGLYKKIEGALVGGAVNAAMSQPGVRAAAEGLKALGTGAESAGSGVKEAATSATAGVKKGFTIFTLALLAVAGLWMWRVFKKTSGG